MGDLNALLFDAICKSDIAQCRRLLLLAQKTGVELSYTPEPPLSVPDETKYRRKLELQLLSNTCLNRYHRCRTILSEAKSKNIRLSLEIPKLKTVYQIRPTIYLYKVNNNAVDLMDVCMVNKNYKILKLFIEFRDFLEMENAMLSHLDDDTWRILKISDESTREKALFCLSEIKNKKNFKHLKKNFLEILNNQQYDINQKCMLFSLLPYLETNNILQTYLMQILSRCKINDDVFVVFRFIFINEPNFKLADHPIILHKIIRNKKPETKQFILDNINYFPHIAINILFDRYRPIDKFRFDKLTLLTLREDFKNLHNLYWYKMRLLYLAYKKPEPDCPISILYPDVILIIYKYYYEMELSYLLTFHSS